MRERYVVAAMHYVAFGEWCRTHDINPGTVTYLGDRQHLEGLRDYHLVLLRGYHRHPLFRDHSRAIMRLLKFAFTTYYEWDEPVVHQGQITGWQ